MRVGNALFAAWNPQPHTPDGLEAIRAVLIALENGRPMEEASGLHLKKAFQMYLDGDSDISKNLGLRPRQRRCNEAPLRRERYLLRGCLGVRAFKRLGEDSQDLKT